MKYDIAIKSMKEDIKPDVKNKTLRLVTSDNEGEKRDTFYLLLHSWMADDEIAVVGHLLEKASHAERLWYLSFVCGDCTQKLTILGGLALAFAEQKLYSQYWAALELLTQMARSGKESLLYVTSVLDVVTEIVAEEERNK